MTVGDRLNRKREARAPEAVEPGVLQLALHYRDRLLKEADLAELTALPPRILRAKIEGLVAAMMREEGRLISHLDRAQIITFIADEAVGYGPLEPLLKDPSITEIMINGPRDVYVEREGRISKAPEIVFQGEEHIRHIIDRIISPLGKRIDESSPMVDARLPDGSRVNAIIPPLSLSGPVLTIRRFPADPIGMEKLLEYATLTPAMAQFLRACVVAKLNILISGGTGSGKTTTLNVLAGCIPSGERVITIEDSAELQFFRHHPHVLRQESRPPNVEGEGEVTIRQLVRNALRMRPNRIIVGEVRGAEALDMLQAMNTGHEGSLTTIHANSPQDAFSRLETMVMWAGTELPSTAIREQLVGALDIVVHQERLPDGTRVITRISEIQGVKKGQIIVKDIFLFDMIGLDAQGVVLGDFTPSGILPRCLPRLRAYGVEIPREIFQPAHLVPEVGLELLGDPEVTEILVNGPGQVFVERNGRLEPRSDIRFRDEQHLIQVINTIVAPLGRRIDEEHPTVEAWLPDGSRVHAVLPPVALGGPVLAIRRTRTRVFALQELIQLGTLDSRMARFLQAAVQAHLNIMVVGGSGSGKTSLLNVLASFIPEHERVVSVEEIAELRLGRPQVVRLVARPPDEEGRGEITLRELVRTALRMSPQRLILGELHGAEALELLQAMKAGQEGSLATIHANSAHDAFTRLETMLLLSGIQIPPATLRDQLMTAIHLVVQINRLVDGSRRVVGIFEVQYSIDGRGQLKEVFRFRSRGEGAKGRVRGDFTAAGFVPRVVERIRAQGVELSPGLFKS